MNDPPASPDAPGCPGTYIGDVTDDATGTEMSASAPSARSMWHQVEALHAVVYFAPEPIAAYRSIGLRGYWMGYFASRSAPMGPVAAAVVDATFYNFAPRLVHRAIPDAWSFAQPEQVLHARAEGAGAALGRIIGGPGGDPPHGISRAVDLLRRAVDGLDCAGRPLAAAHAALVLPDHPVQALWHLATVVREHRGDGHVAMLVGAELSGCEAHVMHVAAGVTDRPTLQSARGWEDQEWDAAEQSLVDRGWLDAGGRLTDAGRSARSQIEADTDRLASAPWARLGPDLTAELADLLAPWAAAVLASETIPKHNPMVLPSDPPA